MSFYGDNCKIVYLGKINLSYFFRIIVFKFDLLLEFFGEFEKDIVY